MLYLWSLGVPSCICLDRMGNTELQACPEKVVIEQIKVPLSLKNFLTSCVCGVCVYILVFVDLWDMHV